MPFSLNGVAASIAPYQQDWKDIVMGRDHTNRPIFSATKSVQLNFDSCTAALFDQWAVLDGTSLTSIQLLNLTGSSFVTYTNSGIYFEITNRPAYIAGYVGPWEAVVNGIVIS